MKQNDIDTRVKYMAENSVRMELRLWKDKDADILEYLNSKGRGSRVDVIRQALRSQMEKENFNVCNKENSE